jgi:hypothetical protein
VVVPVASGSLEFVSRNLDDILAFVEIDVRAAIVASDKVGDYAMPSVVMRYSGVLPPPVWF